MYFKIEYFRVIHYFYFYLGISDFFSAILGWSDFQKKSIVLIIIGLVNLYFSYRAELKIRELIVEGKIFWVFSHILIVGMTVAYCLILSDKISFVAFLQSTLLITSYIGVFTSLILILIKLNFFRKIIFVLGISKQQFGIKTVLLLKNEKYPLFKEVFDIGGINILKSYTIGASKKIDDILCEIESTRNRGNCLWQVKFLFIYLYEKELRETKQSHKKEKIKRVISMLKKLLN